MKFFQPKYIIFLALTLTASLIFFIAEKYEDSKSITYSEYQLKDNKGREIYLDITKGEYGSEIANKLELYGVIKSSELFYQLALVDSRAKKIAPGRHRVTLGISSKEALDQLLDPSRLLGKLVVREGIWVSEIITLLEESGYKDARDIVNTITPPPGFKFNSLEGMLFPATYSFDSKTSTKEIFETMISEFIKTFSAESANISTKQFTDSEYLIMASIIQAEGSPDNYGKISRVIYNRLNQKMPLQMDSTILYAERSRGEIFLSLDRLEIKSEYNTYKNLGLPKAPISNPGRDAIHAAINPEEGDWLYFVTVAPFDTRFANNYEDFLKLKKIYQSNYKKGKFN